MPSRAPTGDFRNSSRKTLPAIRIEQFAKPSFKVQSTTGSQKCRIARGVCPVRFSHCSMLTSSSCSAGERKAVIPRAIAALSAAPSIGARRNESEKCSGAASPFG